MATFHKGNMWDRLGKVDLFCITTNRVITKGGRLVMGRGIAGEAKEKFLNIDRILAKAIGDEELYVPPSDVRLPRGMWGGYYKGVQDIAAFQVKNHFREKANISLIEHSCYLLLREILDRPHITVALNFPGIGYGGLKRSEVFPIISILPDNVEIWEKE